MYSVYSAAAIARIKQDLAKVKHPVTSSLSLPPQCYTDDDWLALETREIFNRGWIALGRQDRWPEPGAFATFDLAGTPIAVLRDNQGSLRAWANSCRHRGMKLLTGEGQCKVIACPFHAWTYALDGELISAPRMETCSDFGLGEYGLVEFRLGCHDGFVFVCLDPDQRELADWLGDFSEIHYPWALEQLVSTRVREFEVDCNWKTFIEVFNEYYHLPYVHPDSLSNMYHEPDQTDPVMGEYTTQFGVTDGTAALLEAARDKALPAGPRLSGRDITGTRYTWVYPNLTFAACFDSLWMYQTYPLGSARCKVIQTIAFPGATTKSEGFSEAAEAYYDRIDIALQEDLPFLQQQQIGLSSRFSRQGRFSALEPSVGNFACWYAETMGDQTE